MVVQREGGSWHRARILAPPGPEGRVQVTASTTSCVYCAVQVLLSDLGVQCSPSVKVVRTGVHSQLSQVSRVSVTNILHPSN